MPSFFRRPSCLRPARTDPRLKPSFQKPLRGGGACHPPVVDCTHRANVLSFWRGGSGLRDGVQVRRDRVSDGPGTSRARRPARRDLPRASVGSRLIDLGLGRCRVRPRLLRAVPDPRLGPGGTAHVPMDGPPGAGRVLRDTRVREHVDRVVVRSPARPFRQRRNRLSRESLCPQVPSPGAHYEPRRVRWQAGISR